MYPDNYETFAETAPKKLLVDESENQSDSVLPLKDRILIKWKMILAIVVILLAVLFMLKMAKSGGGSATDSTAVPGLAEVLRPSYLLSSVKP